SGSFQNARHASGSPLRRAHSIDADRYPITASNHTYRRLLEFSSHPGSGTGMPQSMSRVMARGRTSSSRLSENFRTFGRHAVRVRSQSPSASTNAGRSRKKWFDSTNFG